MFPKKDTTLLIFALLLSALLVVGTGWILINRLGLVIIPPPPIPPPDPAQNRISSGNIILAEEEVINSDNLAFEEAKNRGVTAFSENNYSEAIRQLENALREYPNAPETLIYLNNAHVGNKEAYTIAVSVPLGKDEADNARDNNANAYEDNALAILRGVAQAQKEINESGGINRIPLRVIIADDDNDKGDDNYEGGIAEEVVTELARNPEILGVIGHFSSGTTIAAKEVYDREKLPAISSASTSVDLSERDYVFRTVPNDAYTASTLASYMLKVLGQRRVAIFFDSKSNYSLSLSRTFAREIELNEGEVVVQFDLSSPTFNASDYVNQAIRNGAEVLMLAAHGGNLPNVYQVIQANNRQLKLLGGDELYTIDLLISSKVQNLGELTNGMVVGVAWENRVKPDPRNLDSEFVSRAEQLWGAKVNWHTAMAYDAAKAFIQAISSNARPSRESVYEALSDTTNFSTSGASYPVQFTSEGDRFGKVYLMEIQPENLSDPYRSQTGYDFIPITP